MVADVMRQLSTSIPMFPPIAIVPRYPPKFKEHQKKIYYCQRCLNHGNPRPRKNHKCECPYADCTCEKCLLVEKRRILNIRLQNYNTPNENPIEIDFDTSLSIEDDDNQKLKGG